MKASCLLVVLASVGLWTGGCGGSKNATISTHLQCQNAQKPGEFADCALVTQTTSKLEVELTSRECQAKGDTLQVLAPVQMTLFTDGCYEPALGTKFTISDNGNPFPAGTSISLQMVSGSATQVIPPSLVVVSGGPPWVLRFDDGEDNPPDEDITLTIRAVQ